MVSVLETAVESSTDAPAVTKVPWWALILAASASAAMLWFGTGLTPIAALTWLAPLPMFVVAARTRGWMAAGTAAAAWFAGSLNMFTYFLNDLQMPAIVVVAFLAVQAGIFALAIVLFRIMLHRQRVVLAVLGAAAAWAAGEFLLSLVSPGGAFSSLAYTQAEVLPVIQLASLTGVWGVSFLLMAVPAALGALGALASGMAARTAWPRLGAVLCVLAIGTVGYGAWQLGSDDSAPPLTIGLIDVRQTEDSLLWGSPEGRRVLETYLSELPGLASSGATIAVLPEKVFKVSDTELAELGNLLTQSAADNRMTIVIGLTLKDSQGVHNVAMAYSATGFVRYDKQHLVPGWEDHFTPGHELTFLPGTHIGLVVCKDMDYPAVARSYAQQGGRLLLVPALDVDRDGWLHSRIALVRGVETGSAVVRSAGHGRLTASSDRGEIISDTTTAATVAVHPGTSATPYARFGDWFGWLCVALATMFPFIRRSFGGSPGR